MVRRCTNSIRSEDKVDDKDEDEEEDEEEDEDQNGCMIRRG